MDSLTGGRMEDSMAGIEIDFNVACSAIILACPNEDLFSMRNRLGDLGKKHNLGDYASGEFRDKFYLESINRFWGMLDVGGYSDSCVSHLHLNIKGIEFLERKVLEAFGDNTGALGEFLENADLELYNF